MIRRVIHKTVFNVDVPEGTDLRELTNSAINTEATIVDEVEEWYEPFGMPGEEGLPDVGYDRQPAPKRRPSPPPLPRSGQPPEVTR